MSQMDCRDQIKGAECRLVSYSNHGTFRDRNQYENDRDPFHHMLITLRKGTS